MEAVSLGCHSFNEHLYSLEYWTACLSTLYLCLEYSLGQNLAGRFRARSLYTKGAIK